MSTPVYYMVTAVEPVQVRHTAVALLGVVEHTCIADNYLNRARIGRQAWLRISVLE